MKRLRLRKPEEQLNLAIKKYKRIDNIQKHIFRVREYEVSCRYQAPQQRFSRHQVWLMIQGMGLALPWIETMPSIPPRAV